jgi:hypothetical protein
MKHSTEYAARETCPRKLSKKEAANPHSVIEEFFEYATLPQAKDKLWAWLETTVTGSFNKELNCRERCNMVFFYQRMEKLMEAAHIIHMHKKDKKPGNKQK